MIDTHSHLYEPDFATDIDEVVARARAAGVEHILLPNINKESVDPMLALCRAYPGYFFPMMGLHPEDVRDDWAQVLSRMEELLRQPDHPYVAVGEVGLDLYWDRTYEAQQIEALRRQVEWAARFRLPLMIHCRSAHRQLVGIMEEFRQANLGGVFHCFGGTVDEALELLSFPGFALGIGGVVTFKKSTLPQVLAQVPLGRIVLETDSPYLAPVPHRGGRNESSYLVEIRDRLAQIYQTDPDEVERQTNATAKRIFLRINPPETPLR